MLRTLAAYLVLATAIHAAEPKAVISGRATAAAESTVILYGTGSTGDPDKPLRWKVKEAPPGWTVQPLPLTPEVQGALRGSVLLLPELVAGRYLIVLSVRGTVDGEVQADADAHEIIVSGGPNVPPGPGPDPPGPTPPDLTAQAKQWYATVPAAARTRAKDVQETIHEVGSRAGELGAIAACDLMLQLGLSQSFGDHKPGWAAFAASADAVLAKLKGQGVTVAQYGQALVEIARGIEP